MVGLAEVNLLQRVAHHDVNPAAELGSTASNSIAQRLIAFRFGKNSTLYR